MAKKPRVQMTVGAPYVAPPTTLQMYKRVAGPLLGLLNPLVLAGYWLWLVPLVKQRIVKKWIVTTVFVGLTIVALLLSAGRAYVSPYVEIANVAVEAVRTRSGAGAVLNTVATSWPTWLRAQAPFALVVSGLVAAGVAQWRAMYDAEWRREKKKPSKAAVRRAVERLPQWPQKPKERLGFSDLLVTLGVDRDDARPFTIPASSFGKHCYIDGPSGFGKTTDLIEIMRGLIEAPAAQPFKIGMCFVNMKPDPDIRAAAEAVAAMAGRRLHVITQDGVGATTTYNPLRHGTPEQIRNRVIETEKNSADGGFSEPHYLRSGSRFTLLACRALVELSEGGHTYQHSRQQRPWRRDLIHLARIMSLEELATWTPQFSDELAADLDAYMSELHVDRDLAKGGSGMRQRVADASEGAARAVLVDREDGLDLRQVIEDGDMVLFDLDAAADAQAATYIGNLAIQDLTAAFAELGARRWNRDSSGTVNRMFWVPVDEFSALGGTSLKDLFARARSNGGAVTLATQETGALELAGPDFKEIVLTNTNVQILHNQSLHAEDHSKNAGTATKLIETFQTFDDHDVLGQRTRASGQGSLREGDAFRVHPNELRELAPGEAIVLVKAPHGQHRVLVRRSNPVGDAAKWREQQPVPVDADKPVATEEPPAAEELEPTAAKKAVGEPEPVEAVSGSNPSPWASASRAARSRPEPEAVEVEELDDDSWLSHAPAEPPADR